MKQSGIYRWLCVPTGTKYIGQAFDLEKRKRQFLNFGSRYATKSDSIGSIDEARAKYPEEKFWDYKVLLECDKGELNRRERICIAINQTYTKGYNQTRGGTKGTKGYTHTSKTRSILSSKQRLHAQTVHEEIRKTRAKYASSFVDRNNPEYKKRLSEALIGHIESPETREKIRRSQEKNMKPVAKLDENLNLIGKFNSIADAARSITRDTTQQEFHRCYAAVKNCLNPKNAAKTARGYHFEYADI